MMGSLVLYSNEDKSLPYAYVKIIDGRVTEIGGHYTSYSAQLSWCWKRNQNRGKLQEAMLLLFDMHPPKGFPEFYGSVRNRVDDGLLPLNIVERNRLEEKIDRTEGDVVKAQENLARAKRKLVRLNGKLHRLIKLGAQS